MPPIVFTARISPALHDPDALDITRAGAERFERERRRPSPGAFLAPSRRLLDVALRERARAAELRKAADEQSGLFGNRAEEARLRAAAEAVEAAAWGEYEPAFTAEMRVSLGLRPNAPRWGELEALAHVRGVRPAGTAWRGFLALERVVLVCFCTDETRCHRSTLRTRILPALGCRDGGEIVPGGPQKKIACVTH